MIRFSCPGCQAVYTVGPEKAGKTGKCPKCQSQFSIPKADGSGMSAPPAPAPVSAPAPVADPDTPVEIAPCPSCGTALTVATQYLGMDVECPTCKNVFAAKLPGTSQSPSKTTSALARVEAPADDEDDDRPSKKKSKRVVEEDEDEDDRPVKKSKRVVDEDEEDDRPSKKSKRVVDEDEDDERPSKKSKRSDDDNFDDRPKKKKKKKRTSGIESKRMMAGILALFLGGYGVHKFYLGYTSAGIITIVCCFGGFGIIPLIEAIIYLTKTDEEFIETYQIGEKQWF